jgi:hypothetical protein
MQIRHAASLRWVACLLPVLTALSACERGTTASASTGPAEPVAALSLAVPSDTIIPFGNPSFVRLSATDAAGRPTTIVWSRVTVATNDTTIATVAVLPYRDEYAVQVDPRWTGRTRITVYAGTVSLGIPIVVVDTGGPRVFPTPRDYLPFKTFVGSVPVGLQTDSAFWLTPAGWVRSATSIAKSDTLYEAQGTRRSLWLVSSAPGGTGALALHVSRDTGATWQVTSLPIGALRCFGAVDGSDAAIGIQAADRRMRFVRVAEGGAMTALPAAPFDTLGTGCSVALGGGDTVFAGINTSPTKLWGPFGTAVWLYASGAWRQLAVRLPLPTEMVSTSFVQGVAGAPRRVMITGYKVGASGLSFAVVGDWSAFGPLAASDTVAPPLVSPPSPWGPIESWGADGYAIYSYPWAREGPAGTRAISPPPSQFEGPPFAADQRFVWQWWWGHLTRTPTP